MSKSRWKLEYSTSDRVFRRLLWTYPKKVRKRFEVGMRYSFASELSEARSRGTVALVGLWIRASWHACLFGLLERLFDLATAFGYGRRNGKRRTQKSMGGQRMRGAFFVSIGQDIRLALRSMVRRPGFAMVVILTLALGFGVSTAVFNLAVNTLYPRLPVHDPDRLIALRQFNVEKGYFSSFSYPTYLDYKQSLRTFSGIAAHVSLPFNLTLSNGSQRIAGELVSGNYFSVLGVSPAVGRGFSPDDGRDVGAQPEAVVSHGLWRSQFGSDTSLVGSTLLVNGHGFTVVGVAPQAFSGLHLGGSTDLWIPLSMRRQALPTWDDEFFLGRGAHWLSVVGRLDEETDQEQASAETAALARGLAEAFPEKQSGWTARLVPVSEAALWPPQRERLRQFTVVLSTAVSLISLLVCANVASMLVGHVAARRSEMAVRLALGARRSRLVRQFLTETLALALPAAVLGLLAALWVSGLFADYQFTRILPAGLEIGLDARAIAFLIIATLLVSALVALITAIQATRQDLGQALRVGGPRNIGGTNITATRRFLTVGQVAGSLALLVCGGLLIRSALSQLNIDLGFQSKNVVLLSLDLGLSQYSEESGGDFYRQVIDRIEDIPGVSAVSAAAVVPLGRRRVGADVSAAHGDDAAQEPRQLSGNVVAAGYFETMGIPLLEGRAFDSRDTDGSSPTVIVSESAARLFWPNEDPMGKRLEISGGQESAEVVGVARDARMERDLFAAPGPFFYLPLSQRYQSRVTLHVRTAATDAAAMVPPIRAAVAAVDPHVPTYEVRTLEDHVRRAVGPAVTTAAYVATLGMLGLLLAAIGVYSVISYSVIQRTHEIGIRMSLGAAPQAVLAMMLRQGLRLFGLGLVIGLAAAFFAGRMLDRFLYGVSYADSVTFVAAFAVTAVVSFIAVYVPAWRATRVDPLTALRAE